MEEIEMALGRRKSGGQEYLFVLATDLPKSVGLVFYQMLNTLMREASLMGGSKSFACRIIAMVWGDRGRSGVER